MYVLCPFYVNSAHGSRPNHRLESATLLGVGLLAEVVFFVGVRETNMDRREVGLHFGGSPL